MQRDVSNQWEKDGLSNIVLGLVTIHLRKRLYHICDVSYINLLIKHMNTEKKNRKYTYNLQVKWLSLT